MEIFSGWRIVLLLVAGYIAVSTLIRLMLRRRQELLEELRREAGKGGDAT